MGLAATGAATGFGLAVGAAAAAGAEVTAVVVGAAAAAPTAATATGLSASSVACWIHTNNKRTNAAGLYIVSGEIAKSICAYHGRFDGGCGDGSGGGWRGTLGVNARVHRGALGIVVIVFQQQLARLFVER